MFDYLKIKREYNRLKLESETTIKNLQNELTKKINEIEELKIDNKDLMKKNSMKNKQIKKYKEELRSEK